MTRAETVGVMEISHIRHWLVTRCLAKM